MTSEPNTLQDYAAIAGILRFELTNECAPSWAGRQASPVTGVARSACSQSKAAMHVVSHLLSSPMLLSSMSDKLRQHLASADIMQPCVSALLQLTRSGASTATSSAAQHCEKSLWALANLTQLLLVGNAFVPKVCGVSLAVQMISSPRK